MSLQIVKVNVQDYAAASVAVIMAGGTVLLGYTERPIPPEMSTSLGAAIIWLFVRSVQQAQADRADIDHRAL